MLYWKTTPYQRNALAGQGFSSPITSLLILSLTLASNQCNASSILVIASAPSLLGKRAFSFLCLSIRIIRSCSDWRPGITVSLSNFLINSIFWTSLLYSTLPPLNPKQLAAL